MAFLYKRTYPSGKKVYVIYYRDNKIQKSIIIGDTDKRTATEIFNKFCTDRANNKFGLEKIKDIHLN